jgi:hypothetical protein
MDGMVGLEAGQVRLLVLPDSPSRAKMMIARIFGLVRVVERCAGGHGRRPVASRAGSTAERVIPSETRLKTPTDVIEMLQEQVAMVRHASRVGAVEQARTVEYLLTVALKAIEAGTTAEADSGMPKRPFAMQKRRAK